MNTIERAIKNSPILAALTIFVLGLSVAIAAVGLMAPDLLKPSINLLLFIMCVMGVAYLIINRKGTQGNCI